MARLLTGVLKPWQQLDVGEVRNQADIARREGIARARVTQILGLLRLPPKARARVHAMREDTERYVLSEHMLRRLRVPNPQNVLA